MRLSYLFLSLILCTGHVWAATPAVDAERKAALEFRKIFADKARSSYQPEDIQKLIFLPNEALLDRRIEADTVEGVLAAHRSKLESLLPSQLYQEARQTPHPAGPVLTAKHPVTIVIIPGIFGEFIDHIPYEEILSDRNTAFAKTWDALAADPTFVDPVFDLESMQDEAQPMKDLVTAGSIDNDKGEPQTRIILLKAPKASFETLGTLPESAAIYQRRLDKIFARLGVPDHAYLLGYSRGLNVVLELVSQIKADEHPWIQGFDGVISLGGVTYGSAVADEAFDAEAIPGQMLSRLQRLTDELEIPAAHIDHMDAAALMLRNTGRWSAALVDLAALSRNLENPPGLAMENIHSSGVDPGFLLRTFKEIALDKFQLDRPFRDYGPNIRRFKLFVREASEGMQTLTTEACIAWMKTHTLPERFHYYAITTVMPDPSTPETGIAALTANTLAFEPTGIDYRTLRGSYYSYWQASGMKVNDSQISLDRSPFWPALHQLANPQQKPFSATLLTVLGTDHWGMSFPLAFETTSGKVNPFPRTILMDTLGTYLGAQ